MGTWVVLHIAVVAFILVDTLVELRIAVVAFVVAVVEKLYLHRSFGIGQPHMWGSDIHHIQS